MNRLCCAPLRPALARRLLFAVLGGLLVATAGALLVPTTPATAAVAAWVPPSISGSCLRGGPTVVWTVTNNYPADISGTWTQGAVSGTFAAPAGSTDNFDTPAGDPVTLVVTTPAGHPAPVVSGTVTCGAAGYVPPTVSGTCSPLAPGVTWTVTNPNAVAVSGTWAQGKDSGTFSAPAGGTGSFNTPTGDPVTITVTNPAGVGVPITSTAVTCGPPPPGYTPPTVGGQCIRGAYVTWTVTNPNAVAISGTWAQGKDSGTFSAPAGGTGSFNTPTGDPVTITVTNPAGHTKPITATAVECYTPPTLVGQCVQFQQLVPPSGAPATSGWRVAWTLSNPNPYQLTVTSTPAHLFQTVATIGPPPPPGDTIGGKASVTGSTKPGVSVTVVVTDPSGHSTPITVAGVNCPGTPCTGAHCTGQQSGCTGADCAGTTCTGTNCTGTSGCTGTDCAGGSGCTGTDCAGDVACTGTDCAGDVACTGTDCTTGTDCSQGSCDPLAQTGADIVPAALIGTGAVLLGALLLGIVWCSDRGRTFLHRWVRIGRPSTGPTG